MSGNNDEKLSRMTDGEFGVAAENVQLASEHYEDLDIGELAVDSVVVHHDKQDTKGRDASPSHLLWLIPLLVTLACVALVVSGVIHLPLEH